MHFPWILFFQTLDIVAEHPDKFKVVALAAGSNVTLLADQVIAVAMVFPWLCRGNY